jgi:hypothetical protein
VLRGMGITRDSGERTPPEGGHGRAGDQGGQGGQGTNQHSIHSVSKRIDDQC